MRALRFCYTLNNYTPEEVQTINDFSALPVCRYHVYGREVAPTTGTPHLQGFIIFEQRKTLAWLKTNFSARANFSVTRASNIQNVTYCKKDGDFEEFGEPPTDETQGARSDLTRAREWIDEFIGEHNRCPNASDLARAHPGPFIRYSRGLLTYARAVCPQPILRSGSLRPWQSDLVAELDAEADDRFIIFYVDEDGGSGKTWLQQYYLSTYPEKTQLLSCARRDDMAYSIDESKHVFLINVPRGSMEFLQYSILESLKDRMVYSPKYDSRMKVICKAAHVVVFCNESPDPSKLSADRLILRDPNE